MQILSLIYVCMSVIFLICNSKLLLLISMFTLGCVCVRTRVYGQRVNAYGQSVCPCIYPADHFLYFTYMYMFKYFCPPVGLMSYLCVRPSIYLTAYMHAYVEVCASDHSSVHPFVCIHECFVLACVRECLWAWV